MKAGQIKNIKELSPTLAENFMELEMSSAEWDLYNDKIEPYKNQMGLLKKYFFYNSHDSSILSIKKTNKKDLELVLNDISSLELACALIDKKGLAINKEGLEFPVVISSENTKHLSLNVVDTESGDISPCRFRTLNEYLYEEVITWEKDKVEIAFDLWSNKSNPTNRYLLLLSCARLLVKEQQFDAWRKYFGDIYNDYYKHFDMMRNQGVFLSDYSLCEKLIDEYEESATTK